MKAQIISVANTCMRARMYLEVFSPTEALIALETVVRLLICVCSHMNQHLVPNEQNQTVPYIDQQSTNYTIKKILLI
jgi:hypothetical protein